MFGLALMVISFAAGLLIWTCGIRPHLSRHGRTAITAANWGLSAWADWQQCSELARAKKDSRASTLSTLFILSQLGFILGLLSMLCGI